MNDVLTAPEKIQPVSSETYIAFLTRQIGASREEILEVARHSGISVRRMAEYLVKKQLRVVVSDDE